MHSDHTKEELLEKLNELSNRIKQYENAETRYKETLKKLRKSEEQFSKVVASIDDLIFTMDTEQRFTAFYGRWPETGRLDSSLFLGRTVSEIYPPEVSKVHETANQQALTGKNVVYEWNFVKAGERLYFHTSLSPIIDPEEGVTGVIGIGRDITELKSKEAHILENEQKYRNLFELESDAILMVNNHTCEILDANQSACQLYGYSREELLRMKVTELSNEPEMTLTTIRQRKIHKITGRYHKNKNGRVFPIELTIRFFEWKGLDVHVSAIRDISDRIMAEKELIQAKERAEASERLKSEFLAQMSHEIRSPLNSILSFTSLIKEICSDIPDDDLKMSFGIIDHASKRIIRTIDLILNMSELQTGTYDFVPVRLNIYSDIIEKLYLEFLQHAKTKNIDLILTCNTEDTDIVADEYSLNQIFSNLLDNAVKYTQQGKIEICLSRDKNSRLSVEINDTGVGISSEFLPELFKPFSQEEQGYTRKFEGNGLGLALVKKYIELNNASISVCSEKGKGSSFCLLFDS
ncbi:MAG: PAS domain S-box protein [Ignavibacteriales bacterium]